MQEIELTILIPTYNRKKFLSRTLLELDKQTDKCFYVVISDNHSDYDINEIILQLSSEFQKRITLFRRSRNIGQDGNIIGLFDLCKTKWAWLLSDDDIVYNNSVERINRDVKRYSNSGIINYSLLPFNNSQEFNISTLEEFLDIYSKVPKYYHGDLIFLSNKIYNMEILNELLANMYDFLYTRIGTAILIVKSLQKKITYTTIQNSKIVDYCDENGVQWNIEKVCLGSRTIIDFFYSLEKKQLKTLLRILSFDIRLMIKYYFIQHENVKSTLFFELMYYNFYSKFLPYKEKVILLSFAKFCKIPVLMKMIRFAINKRFMNTPNK